MFLNNPFIYNSHFHTKERNRLQSLALDLLILTDNNLFKIDFHSHKKGDSIELNMIRTPYDLFGYVESSYYNTPLSIKQMSDNIETKLTVHKRDSAKINEIELVIKLRNGKIITTTEHVKN